MLSASFPEKIVPMSFDEPPQRPRVRRMLDASKTPGIDTPEPVETPLTPKPKAPRGAPSTSYRFPKLSRPTKTAGDAGARLGGSWFQRPRPAVSASTKPQRRPSTAKPAGRPAGKPRKERRGRLPGDRGGPLKWSFGGITVSVRLLVFLVVVGVVVVTVVPTAFQWLQQEQAYRNAVVEVETQREYNEELLEQLDDWENEDYIASQARERLGFVRQGETQFVVVDPPQSADEEEEDTREARLGPAKPWSWALLDALQDADDPPPSDQYIDGREPTPKPTTPGDAG